MTLLRKFCLATVKFVLLNINHGGFALSALVQGKSALFVKGISRVLLLLMALHVRFGIGSNLSLVTSVLVSTLHLFVCVLVVTRRAKCVETTLPAWQPPPPVVGSASANPTPAESLISTDPRDNELSSPSLLADALLDSSISGEAPVTPSVEVLVACVNESEDLSMHGDAVPTARVLTSDGSSFSFSDGSSFPFILAVWLLYFYIC